MTERGQRSRKTNRVVAYTAAIVVHAIIIGAVFINFTSDRVTVESAYAEKVDVVRATTIDESQIQQQQDLLKEQELEKQRQRELEQKQLRELQAKAEQEKKNIEDLKKQQELEKEKAAELEKQREALALKRKEEEAAEAERQKKIAEEKKRQEQIAQQKRDEEEAERQRRLQESIAAEEAFLAQQIAKERTTTLTQKHMSMIEQKIQQVRTLSPGIESWRKSVVNIKVSSSGEVNSVSTIESSGNAIYDRSVETAVYKASPLPIPDESAEPEANRLFWEFELIVKVSD